MTVLNLPIENGNLHVDIADGIVVEVLMPQKTAAAVDPGQEIRRALSNPIGSSRLEEVIPPHPGDLKVAVIVDDITRKTPTHLMLPPVLDQVLAAGIPESAISIVFALGTHRPMTRAEIAHKLGREIAERYTIVNTPAWEEESLEYMGESANGVPAWVNRTVAGADIRIGVGMIVPHMDAGFGGGAKIVLPGVCGQRTVEAFHDKQAFMDESQLARADARLRVDLETFVADKVPLDFILNAILDLDGLITSCVAGHPVKAHREGARLAMQVYGTPVARRYPVVVSNAYPYDIDFWQATKALGSAELMAEDGGSLILVAECREAFGEHPLLHEYLAEDLVDIRAMVKACTADDMVAAAEAAAMKMFTERVKVALVSSGITPEQAAVMGFAHYGTVEAAVAGELAGQEDKKVAVLIQGSVQVPMLKK